jgi:hypothetical protein
MAITKRHINVLKLELEKIDILKLLEEKLNEDNTRKRVIEPILMALGYSWDHMESEYDAGRSKSERADLGLKTNGNRIEVLVECKRLNEKLNEKHLNQLNQYFVNLPTTKIAILTNGQYWVFYAPKDEYSRDLHLEPYYTFDLLSYNDEDIETLLIYSRAEFDFKKVLEKAFEQYFMNNFESALVDELYEPSDDFVKAVFVRMGGKRMTDKMRASLGSLINSKSLQKAIDSVIQKEVKIGGLVITTADELNMYHVVKTLLVQSKEFKKQPERITYRDQKTSFNVVLDDNIRKTICKIYADGDKRKSLEIGGVNYQIAELDNIIDLKSELLKAATSYLD